MSNETAIHTLPEIKALIKANLGSPQSNVNAAKALAGERFVTENKKGEMVQGVILPDLSAKGKLQAEMGCASPGCTETHVREMSDWHQSFLCRTHSAAKAAKLTDEEKAARKLARAQAVVAKLTAQ